MQKLDFSYRSREQALIDFETQKFDLLIIGGGITGAATARDAVSRGLKVALVEKNDFAWGTSSRSSKLIHGGLRYLENFEFALVFEALAERAFLLKTIPELVRPLPFYMPVYEGDPHGRTLISMGLWLYDLLALFRTPKFHQRLSQKKLLEQIPSLRKEGLKGGFQYYDASMWDDALVIETLRSAKRQGASIANYIEATTPIWKDDRIVGYRLQDQNPLIAKEKRKEIVIKASQTIVCAGPWTDLVGGKISTKWHPWLNTSKGIHLVFDLKRIPIPGAILMSHPDDGRIAFVIPRPDFGDGVVIVGTTDGATDANPEKAVISEDEVDYLLNLLSRYFPELNITLSDVVSAYVGVRPLMGESQGGSEGQKVKQKVSREHHIAEATGGVVMVAGGKYTTHRKMALEIVDFTLKLWKQKAKKGLADPLPIHIRSSQTKLPLLKRAEHLKITSLPQTLYERYGSESEWLLELQSQHAPVSTNDPEGFPWIESQLRYEIRTGMVVRLDDFYLRRAPLFLSRKDHGLPWAERLSEVWAEEMGFDSEKAKSELIYLKESLEARQAWLKRISTHKEV